MISMDKQYKTRDGNNVRLLCVDQMNKDYPVVALILCEEREMIVTFNADGIYRQSKRPHNFDLIELKPVVKVTRWLCITKTQVRTWNLESDARNDAAQIRELGNQCTVYKLELEVELE